MIYILNKKKIKKVPKGRTIATNDLYFGKNEGRRNKERGAVVLEVNDLNQLGLVALSTTEGVNKKELKGYGKNGNKVYFKIFLEITDSNGAPIVINDKFRANHKKNDLNYKQLNDIT